MKVPLLHLHRSENPPAPLISPDDPRDALKRWVSASDATGREALPSLDVQSVISQETKWSVIMLNDTAKRYKLQVSKNLTSTIDLMHKKDVKRQWVSFIEITGWFQCQL